ncbi:MAG: HupE/UreJ family protein [Gammaproteobacteria bacterium]|nr:HupE/UreJ family protein [Gammaproteobacteria bacterium]
MQYRNPMRSAALLAALLFTGLAEAHGHPSASTGLTAGLTHPLLGWEHVLSILAVGLLVAHQDFRPSRRLATMFLVVTLVSACGATFLPTIPTAQAGVAWSALALGLLLTVAVRPPALLAASIVGIFALLYGYLHGMALPPGANAVIFGLGFLITTTLLLVAGVWMGRSSRQLQAAWLPRIAGGVVAAAGVLAMA